MLSENNSIHVHTFWCNKLDLFPNKHICKEALWFIWPVTFDLRQQHQVQKEEEENGDKVVKMEEKSI